MEIMNMKSTARRAGRKDSVEADEGGAAPPVKDSYWFKKKKAQHFVYILMIT